ncbi:MAG: TlpA family protein disulfide reductase [Chitinophagaceae bacterium]|nr:TlpA family protein disulfide reductase [Chitinophagaceae bacterium]
MKRHLFLITFLLSATAGQASDPGDLFHFSTAVPAPGQKISFDYSAAAGKLAGATDIRAAIFYYTAAKGAGYYAGECSLRQIGKDKWKGSFILPDSALAFALRLKSGKITEDNNGRGCIFPVYKKGTPVPGSFAAAALLYANGDPLLGLPGKADTAMSLLEKEFSLHPELREKYTSSWYAVLVNIKKQDAYPILDKKTRELLASPTPSEEDYRLAVRLLHLQKKKQPADSVLGIAATRFPLSEIAIQHAENEFYKIKSLDSLVAFYYDFQKNHPATDERSLAAETGSYFASTISSRYIQKKEYRKAIGYAAQMNDAMADYRGYMYNWVALTLLNSDSALSLADSLIQAALSGVDQELTHPEKFKRQGTPLADWQSDIDKYYRAAFNDTYAKILAKKGDVKKALSIQQTSVSLSGGENNGFNEHYIKFLLLAGDTRTARQQSEVYIRENKASDSVKVWFRELYVKEYGSDNGYDDYLANLQSAAKTRFREQAIKEKMNLPSKAFSLKDLDGNEVSLASLHGKVVVIDFWATWCGPCKASFPAMQTAVDKYRKDTNVVFLFIDTWESMGADERLSAVKKFLSDSKYSFHILLDKVVDLEKKQYSVVSDYGVGGIPTKFIIGPQGNIVFKAIGFDGNNDKLISELSVYIDLAKG